MMNAAWSGSRTPILAISRYAFDYIVGILWIAGGVAWAVSTKVVDTTASRLSQIASVPKLPDFVIGFLLAIAGVVLPYCVSVVLKPATLKFVGALQKLDRGLRRWRRSREKPEPLDQVPSLDVLARDRLVSELKCRERDISREVRVTFVQVRNQSAAAYISAIEGEVFFRATAVPASAVLVGGIVYRLPITLHLALSMMAMIALLGVGSWLSNNVFDGWMLTVNTAILLAPETASNLIDHKVGGASDPPEPAQPPSLEVRGHECDSH
jgi:hypothetical protein